MIIEDRIEIVLLMAKLDNVAEVQNSFMAARGTCPDAKTIRDIFKKFKETGSVHDRKRSGRPTIDEDTLFLVSAAYVHSPKKSLRKGAKELAVPKSSIHRILKDKIGMRSYVTQIVQELHPEDFDRRLEMCQTLITKGTLDEEFWSSIIYSDECTFHINGIVNRHNSRIWGFENPHAITEFVRNSPKINVWCGIGYGFIIGPYFFNDDIVNGASYVDMLRNFLHPQLTARGVLETAYFQQDGAPPHYSLIARNWLDEHFPGRWLGRRGPLEWAARSPDLTPCDFYLWGFIKNTIYQTAIINVQDLKDRVTLAINSIAPEVLINVFNCTQKRMDKCIKLDGHHIEPYIDQ